MDFLAVKRRTQKNNRKILLKRKYKKKDKMKPKFKIFKCYY